MELDLVRRNAVDAPFGFREQREARLRQLGGARRQPGAREQVPDLAPPPVRVALIGRADLDVERADPGDLHLARFHRDPGKPEAAQPLVQRRAGSAEVEERGDHHVAGDSSDRLEDERAHLVRASPGPSLSARAACDCTS